MWGRGRIEEWGGEREENLDFEVQFGRDFKVGTGPLLGELIGFLFRDL